MKLYLEDNEQIPAIQVLNDADPAPSGYTNVSQDLLMWEEYALNECTDYYQLRSFVNEQLDIKTWVNLSNDERDFIISMNLKETSFDEDSYNVLKVTHVLTTGQAGSVEDARLLLVDNWSSHHLLDVESCRIRANSKKAFDVVGKYLSFPDATDFFETTEGLYIGYILQGIKGTDDNTEIGWFNYIESTVGTVYEFAGLSSKGYTMQNGDLDEANLISDLMDVLRNGNY